MIPVHTYLTLEKPAEGLYKEKGSKFIALAFPVSDEQEIKKMLQEVRKKYHDARHHCYAYRLNPEGDHQRANDDQEPSGTAGKPILNQILSANLTNVLVVVVRYFGGTKLGVSGLINAYKTAARDMLEQASVIEQKVMLNYRITFPFGLINEVMRILKEENAKIIAQESDDHYSINCDIWLANSSSAEEKLLLLQGVEYHKNKL